jgi:hypothetical protein
MEVFQARIISLCYPRNFDFAVLMLLSRFQPHKSAPRPQFDGSAFPPRFDLHPEGDF